MKFAQVIIEDRKIEGIINNGNIEEITGNFFDDYSLTGKKFPLSSAKFLTPCNPSKIVAIGLNYKDHAKEFGSPIPDEPMLFMKPSTSVIGHKEKIIYPPQSRQVDYEGELAIVIGKRCKDVSEEEAKEYVAGFTCANDITARDLQRKDGQFTRGKGFDTFAPLGPVIETELDPNHLKIKTYLNGKIVQDSSTNLMIFKPYFLVSFISKIMTLLPEDVIITGTPPGVGSLKVGDEIAVEIEGIGRLENSVDKES
ncbi:MAG: FAA hydrolase family protein [Candidatus Schekmanbacteria bacterium]|nr:MAG: FAA hydrolase family protein [Candidatus Schekmanbacteria bacterium]